MEKSMKSSDPAVWASVICLHADSPADARSLLVMSLRSLWETLIEALEAFSPDFLVQRVARFFGAYA